MAKSINGHDVPAQTPEAHSQLLVQINWMAKATIDCMNRNCAECPVECKYQGMTSQQIREDAQ